MTNKVLLSLVLLLSMISLYPKPPKTNEALNNSNGTFTTHKKSIESGTTPKPRSHWQFTVTSSTSTEVTTRPPLPRSKQREQGMNPYATPFTPGIKPPPPYNQVIYDCYNSRFK